MNITKCQMQSTCTMHEDKPEPLPLPFYLRWKINLSHHLDPGLKRHIKQTVKQFHKWRAKKKLSADDLRKANVAPTVVTVKIGDMVRIRSVNEVRATLDSNNRLKGCKFMPEMEQYCGTIQRVFKPVERYVNEWDYTIRKSKGLVLLENLFCQGVADSGRCDRSCFYFWRVEWLEFVDKVE